MGKRPPPPPRPPVQYWLKVTAADLRSIVQPGNGVTPELKAQAREHLQRDKAEGPAEHRARLAETRS